MTDSGYEYLHTVCDPKVWNQTKSALEKIVRSRNLEQTPAAIASCWPPKSRSTCYDYVCSIEHLVPTLNPALFEPLKRIENAARRASGMLLTAPDVSATKDEMIAKEIQEMRDALQAFHTAIEAGEIAGFKNGSMRSHGGT